MKNKYDCMAMALTFINKNLNHDGSADVNFYDLAKYIWKKNYEENNHLLKMLANNASRTLNRMVKQGFIEKSPWHKKIGCEYRPTEKARKFLQTFAEQRSSN